MIESMHPAERREADQHGHSSSAVLVILLLMLAVPMAIGAFMRMRDDRAARSEARNPEWGSPAFDSLLSTEGRRALGRVPNLAPRDSTQPDSLAGRFVLWSPDPSALDYVTSIDAERATPPRRWLDAEFRSLVLLVPHDFSSGPYLVYQVDQFGHSGVSGSDMKGNIVSRSLEVWLMQRVPLRITGHRIFRPDLGLHGGGTPLDEITYGAAKALPA